MPCWTARTYQFASQVCGHCSIDRWAASSSEFSSRGSGYGGEGGKYCGGCCRYCAYGKVQSWTAVRAASRVVTDTDWAFADAADAKSTEVTKQTRNGFMPLLQSPGMISTGVAIAKSIFCVSASFVA